LLIFHTYKTVCWCQTPVYNDLCWLL